MYHMCHEPEKFKFNSIEQALSFLLQQLEKYLSPQHSLPYVTVAVQHILSLFKNNYIFTTKMMDAKQMDSNGAFLVVDKVSPLEWIENFLFFGALGSAFLYLLYFQLIKRQWYLRVRRFLFTRKPDLFAEVEGSEDDDDGFVDGDALGNLNPEHSVEQYRRQRFEAAAAAVKHSAVQEMYNLPRETPLRRRGNLA